MPSDVSIVVADAARMAAIRDTANVPGRVMHFVTASLGSAMESIRAYRPKVVAVDAIFAQTAAGSTFMDRVDALGIAGGTIALLVEREGRCVMVARGSAAIVTEPRRPAAVVAPSPQGPAPASTGLAFSVQTEALNTRRVPRFLVQGPLEVVVENGSARLVDLSVLGAQVVSGPVLRPRQTIKVELSDVDEMLNLVANVAWSMFERPALQAEPHYRVGLEFSGAAQKALDEYRQRHCANQPRPLR